MDMSLKMFPFKIGSSFLFIFLVVLAFNPKGSFAQCAGVDAELTICDVSNPANQAIDLFALLGPNAISGGVWTDLAQTQAINLTTGVLNVWEIHISGTYVFTYTVAAGSCVDTNATVTVLIGGYTGVTSPNGSACSDDSSVNLFQFFVGDNFPSPHFNGQWFDNNNSGALNGSVLDATISGLGTFSFTYKIPQIGTCPAVESTAIVTVYRAPEPGDGSSIILCEDDDFSTLTNVNLFDQIQGNDPNGVWSEDESVTSELNGFMDTFIDVQNIFNTSGPGTYTFTYTVFPTNPVCIPKSSSVIVQIEEIIDFTGATMVINTDICEDDIATATYDLKITSGPIPIPSGFYDVDLNFSGATTISIFPILGREFVNGIMTIPLPNELFQNIGSYTITVSDIHLSNEVGVCENIFDLSTILTISPQPDISDVIISIDPTCLNEDVSVNLSNIQNLSNGEYKITYNLVGNNKAFDQEIIISVIGGAANFTIPAELFPNFGNTTLIITEILNLATGCSFVANEIETFAILPLPNIPNLGATVAVTCQNQPALVTLTGLSSLTLFTVTYNLSGANAASNQTANVVAVLDSGNFSIPSTLLPNDGLTILEITAVSSLQTNCSTAINIIADFNVNPLLLVNDITAIIDDKCKNQPVIVLLSGIGNVEEITLNYNLSGANTASAQTVTLSPISGEATFTIPDNLLANSGTTQFTITSITNVATGCASVAAIVEFFVINPLPAVANFVVSVPSVCRNQPVNVLFSSLGNVNNLAITYSLSGANTALNVNQIIAVSGENANFVIPSALLANTGTTTFTITNTVNTETGCISSATVVRNFQINPLPEVTNFTAVVANACKNQPVNVSLSGLGNLSSFSITYNLSGANTASFQTISLTATSGNASFPLPTVLIPNSGESFFSISNIKNTLTNCESTVTAVTDAFTIFDLPPAPLASDAFFCQDQNPLVSDLEPRGPQFKWYDSETAAIALANDFPLIVGNYYVSETNPVTGCESFRTVIAVAIRELEKPILNPDGQNFCGADNPTLSDLANNITAEEQIAWFDAAENGTLLDNAQLLEDGFTYYGFQFSSETNCISNDGVAVRVSLTDCDDDDDDDAFFVPDGFSPNGDTVNDTFRIPDIEFLYPDYTLEIYNRYGNLLFKGNRNKSEWDGRNSDSKNTIDGIAPNGVYFYIINFNKNNVAPKQGRLYLNR